MKLNGTCKEMIDRLDERQYICGNKKSMTHLNATYSDKNVYIYERFQVTKLYKMLHESYLSSHQFKKTRAAIRRYIISGQHYD